MRADSMMSFGIPMKKLRSRKIANGNPKAVWKRIRPDDRVVQVPSVSYTRNIGISAIWSGTTSSAITAMKSQSRPGNSSQANA